MNINDNNDNNDNNDERICNKVTKWVNQINIIHQLSAEEKEIEVNAIISQISRCKEYLRNNEIDNDTDEAREEIEEIRSCIENEDDLEELVLIIRAAKKLKK